MTEPVEEFKARDVYFVSNMMSNHASDSQIRDALVGRGYGDEEAIRLMNHVRQNPKNAGVPATPARIQRKTATIQDTLFVKDMISSMTPDYDMRSALAKRGFSATEAGDLIRSVRNNQTSAPLKRKRSEYYYTPPSNRSYSSSRGGDDGSGKVALGLGIAAIGCAITFFTYTGASGGGTYIIAWGPVVYGLIMAFRGLMND